VKEDGMLCSPRPMSAELMKLGETKALAFSITMMFAFGTST
jgi:hypothetical protein